MAEANKKQFHGQAWDCKLADDCRYQLKKVIFLKGECALAIQECIEQQVYNVVKRGDELGVHTDALDKLRRLTRGDYGKLACTVRGLAMQNG